ncbi:hypothetical protein B7H19_03175 [Pseudomonas putida]|nr:hypothetical protein B7H19_03175 [Pseudomonas putida]
MRAATHGGSGQPVRARAGHYPGQLLLREVCGCGLTAPSDSKQYADPVGAGEPAKQVARWMARASPVFAGKPASTVIAQPFRL